MVVGALSVLLCERSLSQIAKEWKDGGAELGIPLLYEGSRGEESSASGTCFEL